MIWHFYGNNEKVIMTDSPYEKQSQLPQAPASISSTDEDEDEYWVENEHAISKKPYITTNTQSLFLNFNSDLCLQKTRKKKSVIDTKIASTSTKKQAKAIKVNGVNILNRKDMDSKTVVERIQKRRENHNHIERRRRDCINDTIYKLSQAIPNVNATVVGQQKLNKHNVLKSALDHILLLQSENSLIKQQLLSFEKSVESSPSYLNSNTPYNTTHTHIMPSIPGHRTVGVPTLQQQGPTTGQYSYYHHMSEFQARNLFHVP